MTRKRMTALKYSAQMIDDVSQLVELHLRFHTYKLGWSDAAVRRYVRDAGHLLADLNELTRCDCTTRNPRKAAELSKRMDSLEIRIDELRKKEDIDNQRPALDGQEVMDLLGLAPSRDVGVALDYLLALRHAEGEVSKAEATFRLREAWPLRDVVSAVLRPLKCKFVGKALYALLDDVDEDEIDDDTVRDVLVPWHEDGRCEQELYE